MERARDVEVVVTFLPTEHGGRKKSARSGYRPQFYYAGHDWDAVHEYPDVTEVKPGETVRCFLAFLSPMVRSPAAPRHSISLERVLSLGRKASPVPLGDDVTASLL